MTKVLAEGTLKDKKVFGGNVSGTAKVATIGSHIPNEIECGHWTASHIIANSARMEFSGGRVADKPISTLDPRNTTTVALYVTPYDRRKMWFHPDHNRCSSIVQAVIQQMIISEFVWVLARRGR